MFRCEGVGFGEGIDVAFETACLCRSQAEAVYRLLYCLGRLSCLTSVERRGQFLKRTNELCISLGFGGELRLHLVERQEIIVEQTVEVGGLPAGIGEVEGVVVLLRVEHQGDLLGALHIADQRFVLGAALCFEARYIGFLFGIILFEFGSKHTEGACQIALTKHRRYGQCKQEGE